MKNLCKIDKKNKIQFANENVFKKFMDQVLEEKFERILKEPHFEAMKFVWVCGASVPNCFQHIDAGKDEETKNRIIQKIEAVITN